MGATWSTVLIESALKGAVILAIVALAMPFLRRSSAALRHAVWSLAVGAQLLLPALTVIAPQWRVPIMRPAQGFAAISASRGDARRAETIRRPSASHDAATPLAATEVAGASPLTSASERGISEGTLRTVTLVWLVGVALVILHLAVGTIGVWRLATRGRRVLDARWLTLSHQLAARLGISRPLTLLGGGALAVPVTWGVVYPVVLLPADADAWDDEQRQYVLVHEMAHVRRFDALTHLIGQVTLALFWFDPLVWLAVSRMRAEREHACDDYVLLAGTTPSRYANDLLTMVESIALPNHRAATPAFASLAMVRPSEFEGRMLAILKDETNRAPLTRRTIAGSVAATALVALGLAGFTPLAAREAGTQAVVAQAPSALAEDAREAYVVSAPRGGAPTHTRRADTPLDRALAAMPAGSAKTAILANYVVSGDTAQLTAALRAVPSLSSDRQKSIVISNAARLALSGGEASLRDAYFTAVGSISADQERRNVLAHAAANANGSPAVTMRILRAVATIRSSGIASTALIDVAARSLVSTDSLRAVYLRLATGLISDNDRQRALVALMATTSAPSHQP